MDPRHRLLRFGASYGVVFGIVAILYPYFPLYLAAKGLEPGPIGLVMGGIEIAGIAAPVIIAQITDRTGRFRLIILILILSSMVLLLLVDRSESLWAVVAATAVWGFFQRPVIPLVDALTGRVLKDVSGNYGRVRVWGSFGFVAVSLALQFSGLLDHAGRNRLLWSFVFVLGIQALALPLLPSLSRDDHKQEKASGASRGFADLPAAFWTFIGICLVGRMGLSSYDAFGSLYMREHLGLAGVSGLFAVAAFSETPFFIYGGHLLLKLGHRRMLAIAFLAGALRLVVMALAESVLPILFAQLLHGLAFGFYWIVGVDLVNRMVPARSRALGMSLYTALGMGFAQFLGSSAGGWIIEAWGFRGLYLLYAFLPLAALLWLLLDSSACKAPESPTFPQTR